MALAGYPQTDRVLSGLSAFFFCLHTLRQTAPSDKNIARYPKAVRDFKRVWLEMHPGQQYPATLYLLESFYYFLYYYRSFVKYFSMQAYKAFNRMVAEAFAPTGAASHGAKPLPNTQGDTGTQIAVRNLLRAFLAINDTSINARVDGMGKTRLDVIAEDEMTPVEALSNSESEAPPAVEIDSEGEGGESGEEGDMEDKGGERGQEGEEVQASESEGEEEGDVDMG
uniref:Uncharacterized protein n=2 Tax=Chromera velia CCMP2878 TaxID=1169474 RepID=A0A0K6S6V1_9ALVE|eukprot:Cvel_17910.t1-p1 / transcript=Cvel_17910.t1 / gene=Cvel_17910 / organism=Chromera_velia_CCMP2878 / gene_product=hypothetical protein / transcript_product=hypothetical protein / location=Cvel_scaffold1455:7044-7715(-) / protein_length=224 / sequence_SO=supercontig / SO=protein_coding / is_pseudo=false